MKKFSLLFIAVLATLNINAQSTNWAIDDSHSSIRFSVAHMVISEIEGNFKKFEGTVAADKEDFSDLKVAFTMDVNSIDTGNEKRDGHLKSPDFFDTAKHASMSFKSKSVKKVKDGVYKVTGDFTMIGVTKEVTLDAKHIGTVNDPWGNTKAGFKVTGALNRTDWGLKYNSVMDNGGVMIGETVNIVCNVELAKAK